MKYRHLPHIDKVGYYQFITFRTADSTDDFLLRLSSRNIANNKKQLVVDDYLDSSMCGAYLHSHVLLMFFDFLKEKNGGLYELVAFSIMPNHVHLLVKPLIKLPLMMQKIKGSSARIINEIMGRSGQFWVNDYYDKMIRDEKHFSIVYQYIKNNPLKLGEAKASHPRFYGIYEDNGAGALTPHENGTGVVPRTTNGIGALAPHDD